MKIFLNIQDISIGGGAERVVVNLANALHEMGHGVEVLSFFRTNKYLPYRLNEGIKLEFMSEKTKDKYFINKDKNFFYKLYYKNIWQPLLSLKMKQKYKDFDVGIYSCVYFPYFKNKNTKYIKIEHSRFERYFSRNKYFDSIVILSSKELETWQSFYKNVVVIPNFIPQISDLNANLKTKIVLSVGRMAKNDEKGFNRLIDIWNLLAQDENFKQEFEEWKLVIVGEGEQKQILQEKIKRLNLEKNIILKPFTKEIEKEYLNSSIYAMSSHFEGLPMVLLEACSYALAPISFDIKTGPSDIIENEKSGFLIQDNVLQDFADKLKFLMKDESLREKFGKNAKEKMKKEFSKEAVMKKWEELFKDLKA